MKSFCDNVFDAPLGHTYLFWLGQAGFVIKSATGKLLGIDLYLSECVEDVEGHSGYHRLMPRILDPGELHFDALIATHYHRDHFDIEAIPGMMDNPNTHLFCAYDCSDDVSKLNIDRNRVTFVKSDDRYSVVDFNIRFIASDHGLGAPLAVGAIVTVDGKNILVVGDTSLHLDWKEDYLREGVLDVLIAPINGAYGNLNEQDNVRLTEILRPRLAVPCHFGMFASHGGHPGMWKDIMEARLPEQKYKLFTMGEGLEI